MNKSGLFRLLAVIFGILSIIIVCYFWVNDRNAIFFAVIPAIIGTYCQRISAKEKK